MKNDGVSLIAEVGWNHMGNMELAKKMIESAKYCGANYVKFQSWDVCRLKNGPWDTDGRRVIYEKACLSDSDHHFLVDVCNSVGIRFLTSCFCIDDLERIRRYTEVVKIPSHDCANKELVTKAIDMFEHVIVSVGATTQNEYSWLFGEDKVTMLHCVACYPCLADKINMSKMLYIKKMTPRFGYSGHHKGIWDAIVALMYGAKVIEKHFTIDNNLPGRDNKFAILPEELMRVRDFAETLPLLMIDHGNDYQPEEQEIRDVYCGRWSKEV